MEQNPEKKDAAATNAQPEQPAKPDLNQQVADYRNSLQLLQAEFENYKKRVDRDKLQSKQYTAAEIVKSFLHILDSFELALKSVGSKEPKTESDCKIIKGMEMIYGQFYSALESKGLRPIKALGLKLDPYMHEVLLQEETTDEKKDGIIVEEFQKGYMLNDIVIRYSKVKVLKFAKKEEKK